MAVDCVFCRIIAGDIPTPFLYHDEEVVAFNDIHPLTPVHVLIVPRRHITSLQEMGPEEGPLIGRMALLAKKLAADKGIAERGYRLVINNGPEGGQVVPHLHLHLLGGKKLR
jgi:histidine triad (HIT) family protein